MGGMWYTTQYNGPFSGVKRMGQSEYRRRLMVDMERVGPKRDDPRRQAALLMAGRKNQQAKAKAEHYLRAAQVEVGSYVRVVIEGKKAVQGQVIGEDGRLWIVLTSKGPRPYAKGHCEKAKASEVSKAVRKGKAARPEEEVYGDGDI